MENNFENFIKENLQHSFLAGDFLYYSDLEVIKKRCKTYSRHGRTLEQVEIDTINGEALEFCLMNRFKEFSKAEKACNDLKFNNEVVEIKTSLMVKFDQDFNNWIILTQKENFRQDYSYLLWFIREITLVEKYVEDFRYTINPYHIRYKLKYLINSKNKILERF